MITARFRQLHDEQQSILTNLEAFLKSHEVMNDSIREMITRLEAIQQDMRGIRDLIAMMHSEDVVFLMNL